MDAGELKRNVIVPTLKHLKMYSESAANLLVGTAAQESHLGRWFKQVNGPALGIFQLEPDSINDVYKNYLFFRPLLRLKIDSLKMPGMSREQNAVMNLAYATAIARLIYYRAPEALPAADGIANLAYYWKEYFNTHLGKGSMSEFMHNFPEGIIE